ncbi:MAG: hypothetical protein Q8P67_02710 [archaeon]|nr:hypothetical protein [archaeon]
MLGIRISLPADEDVDSVDVDSERPLPPSSPPSSAPELDSFVSGFMLVKLLRMSRFLRWEDDDDDDEASTMPPRGEMDPLGCT